MSGLISSSDVFAQQKLDVEKCTRMYTFQHACGCFLYAPSICIKSVGRKGIPFVAAHKLILNVSERTGMSVKLSSSEICVLCLFSLQLLPA